MEEKTKVSTEVEEETEEQQATAVNKVVAKALFLSAQKSSKSGKLGITVLLYEGIDEETKQIRVALDQRSVKGQTYTLSPVVSVWFKPEEITPQIAKMVGMKGLSEIYVIISGNGEFRKIHKFLSEKDYQAYLALVG